MRPPTFKCLFCLSSKAPFTHVEHPIPESLGNDDFSLPAGFVCDPCNQYFGSKIEGFVINAPPFGIERVRSNIKTKKGRNPKFEFLPHVGIYSTDFQDQVILFASADYWAFLSKSSRLLLPHSSFDDFLLVRFLLKVGLELLLTADTLDPYGPRFNKARSFSRSPATKSRWQIGYALYPRKEDLVISEREDEISPLITHQLYQYSIGEMATGEVIFSFMYHTHIFACNLSQPSLKEYVEGFNRLNDFKMRLTDIEAP